MANRHRFQTNGEEKSHSNWLMQGHLRNGCYNDVYDNEEGNSLSSLLLLVSSS